MPGSSPAAVFCRTALLFCLLSCIFQYVSAQSSTQSNNSASSTASLITIIATTSYTSIVESNSGNTQVPVATTVIQSVYNATSTLSSPTSTTASTTPTPIVLDTRITPAFGVLGAILILTGLPSAFWGHKNRWTSFFLIGFYTLALVCFVLIIKFGILPALNPPNNTLQGMFVLASAIAGIVGGGITIFFWRGTKYFIGAWGGFAVGLWIQCFRNGGLITSVGLRWILYIGCGVVGFVLCSFPRLHWQMLLVSTAAVGSSAFILGIDCYTTAGLKEFYIWNLGFVDMFPKYSQNGIRFPVSQTMMIELGLIGAIALMGGAVQLRILRVLQRKLKEITEEQKRRDEEAELGASDRLAELDKEREEWERDHPTLDRHGRRESGWSGTPLMKDFPTTDSNDGTLIGDRRPRYQSGVSDLMAAPPDDDELNKRAASKYPKSQGVLPALDLGLGIKDDVPSSFIAPDDGKDKDGPELSAEDRAKADGLRAEIDTLRRSIDFLRSETPGVESSSDSRSRAISLTSRRTLSYDLDNVTAPRPHARPPRQQAPRSRIQSMELGAQVDAPPLGASIGRPTSVPLKDEDWDSYTHDRKLLQPPAGTSVPISTTPMNRIPSSRIPMSAAVADAVAQRKRRESTFEMKDIGGSDSNPKDTSDDDVPIGGLRLSGAHGSGRRRNSKHLSNIPQALQPSASPTGQISLDNPATNVPVILPRPKYAKRTPSPDPPTNVPYIMPRGDSGIMAPVPRKAEPQRVATVEEMEARHREKMRDMQAPVTQLEQDHAKLEDAKSRWERSRAIEKQQVNKRHAEKAAQLAKDDKTRRQSGDVLNRGSTLVDLEKGHRTSLSADKLAAIAANGSSSKRQSVLRVEDWQRRQQDTGTGAQAERSTRPGTRSPGN
ncbi:hypothetical protein CONPUDRAFT_148869 [Coniophora puteana RWD-64-598 SS2]|uniref:TM7S3/TM198-like domain-containing protein n=1 Tax=Coniophora puteana (strain RWD-64-598) TaxID=741705 RepID=A0A5M3N600_CONPW|nr:uncharacterized protein CONPUDRAFT_148869 [Coniophora puteana RWD-64-598 SS2]EIW86823.1 hypothetical protein CONPUDRAFT_148869 [Coniophora puteana RWD-64-598 SS2]